jgi:hypothetical protein
MFTEVHRRFHAEHSLGAFDLFSIIIWKANRAKSRVASRLRSKRGESLEAAAPCLTAGLWQYAKDESRLVCTSAPLGPNYLRAGRDRVGKQ